MGSTIKPLQNLFNLLIKMHIQLPYLPMHRIPVRSSGLSRPMVVAKDYHCT